MRLSKTQINDFQLKIRSYYKNHGRSMPWRDDTNFYSVLVSELMLQQTQVSRVIPKYLEFMHRFPTVDVLAAAQLAEVIIAWQGLGYNRRASYLHRGAQWLISHGIPVSYDDIKQLPGVGANTAGAILAYVYDQPVVFVETNIRSVFFDEFYKNHDSITDKEIGQLVEQTLPTDQIREWYWGLMDYGVFVKSQGNNISKSRHYVKQSRFAGSLRQMRGMILSALVSGPVDTQAIEFCHDERFVAALNGLIGDGLVERHGKVICLTAHREAS